jgi:hypothetical protein
MKTAEQIAQREARLTAAKRYLQHAEAELEAAGENLAAMRVGAVSRGLK